jgi:hypothetical protein
MGKFSNKSDLNMWAVAKASVTGARHVLEGLPCQDNHAFSNFDQTNFAIAVVSDGAGSANHSDKGSLISVEKAVELARKHLPDFNTLQENSPEKWRDVCIKIFNEIYEEIEKYALAHEIAVTELAATIIIMIIADGLLLVGGIGDGRAAFEDMDGKWISCFTPHKGEYINETVFITTIFNSSCPQTEQIFTAFFPMQVKSFALLSDGCENVSFLLRKINEETQEYMEVNEPHEPFFNFNCDTIIKMQKIGMTEKEIDEHWASFLTKGNPILAAEPDDKTMILGTRIPGLPQNELPEDYAN